MCTGRAEGKAGNQNPGLTLWARVLVATQGPGVQSHLPPAVVNRVAVDNSHPCPLLFVLPSLLLTSLPSSLPHSLSYLFIYSIATTIEGCHRDHVSIKPKLYLPFDSLQINLADHCCRIETIGLTRAGARGWGSGVPCLSHSCPPPPRIKETPKNHLEGVLCPWGINHPVDYWLSFA